MNLEQLATAVLEVTEATGVPFMAVGAIAAGAYGIPRSTRDVDLLVAVHVGGGVAAVMKAPELFELFDDPFVLEEFSRRREVFVPLLDRSTWLPSPEDVVVQKLRWGRSKDLDDARDVLAVQGTDFLDMAYIRKWCATHGTTERLEKALSEIPPM